MNLLSSEEQHVVDLLAETWDAFLKLDSVHVSHIGDFNTAIHSAQRIVMSRPVHREWESKDKP